VTEPYKRPAYLPSFSHARSRSMSLGKKEGLKEWLPRVEIALPETPALIDPRQFFDTPFKQCWMEIGFGAGEHLAFQAERNPGIAMIGCEPFLRGTAALMRKVAQSQSNIRIFRQDARLLLERLQPESLDKLFVLFPDPWPKLRHHKRRLISPVTLDIFNKVLKPGAGLRIVSDHTEYADWILQHMLADKRFEWQAKGPGDWRNPPKDWIITRYQEKALAAGRTQITYLEFIKR